MFSLDLKVLRSISSLRFILGMHLLLSLRTVLAPKHQKRKKETFVRRLDVAELEASPPTGPENQS